MRPSAHKEVSAHSPRDFSQHERRTVALKDPGPLYLLQYRNRQNFGKTLIRIERPVNTKAVRPELSEENAGAGVVTPAPTRVLAEREVVCAMRPPARVALLSVGRKPPLPSMAPLPKRTMRRAGHRRRKRRKNLRARPFLLASS